MKCIEIHMSRTKCIIATEKGKVLKTFDNNGDMRSMLIAYAYCLKNYPDSCYVVLTNNQDMYDKALGYEQMTRDKEWLVYKAMNNIRAMGWRYLSFEDMIQ